MQHTNGLQQVQIQNAWLAIGSFDGVHLGHQEIIKQLTAGAHAIGAPAVVLTFYPHPAAVLHQTRKSFYLTMPEEKAALLTALGIDLTITYPFNHQVAAIRPKEFLLTLQSHLNMQQLWVGYDFALGKDREGDIPALKKIGAELGFSVHEVPAYKQGNEIVSSSRIRRLLEEGAIDQVNQLLGRSFSLTGKVAHGEMRGRKLGIPTANLSIENDQAVPGAGVYACLVAWKGQTYQAVTNVGVRPTFEKKLAAPRVEAHILNFSEDIYEEEISLTFISRLREERRFPGPEALVTQIKKDIIAAQEILANIN